MSNLNEIKNYQLTGSKAKKVYSAFETISLNNSQINGMLFKLANTLIVQKYPEINDSTKNIDELTEISKNSGNILERVISLMAINTKAINKLKNNKLNHGKDKAQVNKELEALESNYTEAYNKLISYDADLNNQIESESYKYENRAKTIRKENDTAEEEILTIACETFGLDYESLTISDMDQLLVNLEKANVWGFDFFTKRLEANQKLNKPAKTVK
jgi:hypothetical protein